MKIIRKYQMYQVNTQSPLSNINKFHKKAHQIFQIYTEKKIIPLNSFLIMLISMLMNCQNSKKMNQKMQKVAYSEIQINFFQSRVLKTMSSSNRVLRERRLKDYSTTEIIDGESYGGFRSQQQKSNPETQQTNANARILMKFLNQINRSKLFSYPSGLPSHILKNQTHEPAKRKMVKTEHMLGKTSNTESNKVESYKKNHPSRTPYSNKSSMIPETSKQQKEIKEMNLDKNKKSNENQKLTFCSNGPMESKFNTTEYMKMWSRIQEEKRTIGKKNEQQLMNKLQQRQKKSIQDELRRNGPINDMSTMDESHLEEKGIKYFKRQAYHIAVAYHIHVKHSNQNQLNSLDPTYNAKKLKEKSKKND